MYDYPWNLAELGYVTSERKEWFLSFFFGVALKKVVPNLKQKTWSGDDRWVVDS